jgi:hypothetical protein
LFQWLVSTTIKTDNHMLLQEMRRAYFTPVKRARCQIKSRLLQLIQTKGETTFANNPSEETSLRAEIGKLQNF